MYINCNENVHYRPQQMCFLYKLFIAVFLTEFWCKLPEDDDTPKHIRAK